MSHSACLFLGSLCVYIIFAFSIFLVWFFLCSIAFFRNLQFILLHSVLPVAGSKVATSHVCKTLQYILGYSGLETKGMQYILGCSGLEIKGTYQLVKDSSSDSILLFQFSNSDNSRDCRCKVNDSELREKAI
ncbi:PREDICTED: uncharacterized protein LOC109234344 isoform X1 [Nicotiana attenuata]|uniref:uncharacterized protein LOC109234344 isoform X1 n=1 Tax=Nicotiana attenuata TaxID=49451 RepID=UPI000904C598|nr:PREDICTED: uncharacterized protein LOC109234344 isoform X1 [Nicotiana attenuata]